MYPCHPSKGYRSLDGCHCPICVHWKWPISSRLLSSPKGLWQMGFRIKVSTYLERQYRTCTDWSYQQHLTTHLASNIIFHQPRFPWNSRGPISLPIRYLLGAQSSCFHILMGLRFFTPSVHPFSTAGSSGHVSHLPQMKARSHFYIQNHTDCIGNISTKGWLDTLLKFHTPIIHPLTRWVGSLGYKSIKKHQHLPVGVPIKP